MIDKEISKYETDLLSSAINKIVSAEVLEKDISGKLPLIENLSDSNKIFQGKASVLFVDMRESTKLPEEYSTDQLVKIYRCYIRTVVQAIRYSDGVVRDFMGDGVLAVFIDDEKNKSEDKAVNAARYITTAIDKFLNPVLDRTIKYRISCGIGIHTGNISLSKVGMKGKEQDNESENEYGIAWIGNSTNLACKFSSAVDSGAIFISSSTYAALTNIDDKQKWEKVDILKGSNLLSGYISKQYYLKLDKDIEPCVATSCSKAMSLVDTLIAEYQKQLIDIIRRTDELSRKEQTLQDKEQRINEQEAEVNRKCKENHAMERALCVQKYKFYCEVLRSGHCKKDYVKAMGQDFWEDNLEEVISAGATIGKNEREVKQKVSYAMVSIYADLELYDKAYDFLVEQALGCEWLLLSTVQDIVKEVGYSDRIKSAIYSRLAKDDLDSLRKKEFEKIKDWLVKETT